MKKLFSIFAAIAIFTLSATAQAPKSAMGTTQSPFKKQDFILEGTVSFLTSTGQGTQYSLVPSIGYFVTDRVAVGLNAEISKNSEAEVNNFAAFGRCYFANVKSLQVYSQLNVGRQSGNFASGLGVGANYFLTKRLALSTQLVDLMSFSSGDGVTTFGVGFSGVNNPLAAARFGLLVRL